MNSGRVVFAVFVCLLVPSAAFSDILSPSSLLGYWDFNDDSNPAVASDLSGNAPDGNLLNGAVFSADAGGFSGLAGDRAVNFGLDGATETVHVPGGDFLQPIVDSQAFTFSFWQYRDSATPLGNQSAFWAVSPTAPGTQRGVQAHLPWVNGTLYFDHGGCCGGDTRISQAIDSQLYNGWHHYAFVLGADDSKEVWIDGTMFLSGTGTAPLDPFSDLHIGSARGVESAHRGLIDDFAVFDVKLDAEQIGWLAAKNSPLSLTYTGQYTWNSATAEGNWGTDNWGAPIEAAAKWPIVSPPDDAITATINDGHVHVEANHSAAELTVTEGLLTIDPGQTLTILGPINATNVSLQAGANLTAGSGTIQTLSAAGDATIDVSSGVLTAASLTNSSTTATLRKQGEGTLSVGIADLAAAAQVVDLNAGTLSIQPETISHELTFVLSEDPWALGIDLNYFDTTADADVAALDALLGIGEGGSIDVVPALLGEKLDGVPPWMPDPLGLTGELKYTDGQFTTKTGVQTTPEFYAGLWKGTVDVSAELADSPFTFGTSSDDGSAVWVKVGETWEMIVNNQGIHPDESQVGEVTLGQGTHEIAIAMYQWDGGDSIEARVGVGAGLGWGELTVINPANSDMIAYVPIENPDFELRITGNSVLELASPSEVKLPALTLVDGAVTTRNTMGAPITFAGVNIGATAEAVGLVVDGKTDYGPIDGSAALGDFVFTKLGSSGLTLEAGDMTGMEKATIRAEQGTLTMVGPSAWGGATAMSLGDATIVIRPATAPIPGDTPEGALSHWAFDETDGTVAVNSANPGVYDGIVNNATWTNDPVRGQVISFDGDQDWVDIPTMTDVAEFVDELSYSMWINLPVAPGGNKAVLNSAQDAWAAGDLHFNVQGNDPSQWRWDVNGSGGPAVPPSGIPLGEWHHIAFTYSATDGEVVFYFDGLRDGISARTPGQPAYMGERIIGGWNGARWLEGLLDDVMIYNRILSPEEIGEMIGVEQMLDMRAQSVEVDGNGTLRVEALAVQFGPLTMKDGGVLTTSGAPNGIGFQRLDPGDAADTIIAPDATAVGFNSFAPLDLGVIDGSNAEVTISKTGASDLVVDQPGIRLDAATFDVQGGRLIGLDPGAFGAATVEVGNAELVLGTKDGATSPAVYANAIVADGAATLTAGKGGQAGAPDGPITVQVPGITLNSDVTLQSTDGYSLDVTGALTGTGHVTVQQGQVDLSATDLGLSQLTVLGGAASLTHGATIDSLRLSDGSLASGGDLRVAEAIVSGGAFALDGNRVVVSKSLNLNGVTYGIVQGDLLVAEGTDMLADADLTVSGLLSIEGVGGGGGRFIRVWKNESGLLHIGEIEAFLDGEAPNGGGGLSTNDMALGTLGATHYINVDTPETTTTTTLQHGDPVRVYDGIIQTAGATWSTQDVRGMYVLDLGESLPMGTIRVWQRGDCCYERQENYSVSIFGDDGTGAPGELLWTEDYPGRTPNGSFAEFDDFDLPGPEGIAQKTTNLVVNNVAGLSTVITADVPFLRLGDLRIKPDITLSVTSPAASFEDIAVEGNATLDIGPTGTLTIRGTLLPDITAGTLTVNANAIIFPADSIYAASINATANDRLDTQGSVFIDTEDDTTLQFQINGKDPFTEGTYTLMTATGVDKISGMFHDVTGLGSYLGNVSVADGEMTATVLHNLHPGDADLNLTTDVRDFNVWNTNKFTSGTDWASGDFDGNGVTDVRDFNVWNTNKFTDVNSPAPVAGGQVPEPSTLVLLVGGLAGIFLARRRGRSH